MRRRAARRSWGAVGTTGAPRFPSNTPSRTESRWRKATFRERYYLLYAVDVIGQHFHAQPDEYVSGNLLLYYEEGNPRAVVAPDLFVLKGVPNHRRRTFRLWEERQGPDFVLEVTSRSTWREDQVSSRSCTVGSGCASTGSTGSTTRRRQSGAGAAGRGDAWWQVRGRFQPRSGRAGCW